MFIFQNDCSFGIAVLPVETSKNKSAYDYVEPDTHNGRSASIQNEHHHFYIHR